MSDHDKNARLIAKLIEGADARDFPDTDDPWGSPEPSRTQIMPGLYRMGNEGKAVPKDWLIKGVLARGEQSVIYAPSGGGKSFIALDMAARIATDTAWFNHKVKKTGVLYVAGEGAAGFKHRVIAWRQAMKFHDTEAFDFCVLEAAPDLMDEKKQGHAKIDEAIASIKSIFQFDVGLIVLDTLSRMMPNGIDSDQRDMKMFLNEVEDLRLRTGAHVLLVHHTGKDKDRGMRGSSMLRENVNTVFEVQQPDDGGPRIIKIDRQKDGPEGATYMCYIKHVTLGIDDDDDVISAGYLEPVGGAEPHGNPSTTGQASIAFAALDEALAEGGMPPPVTAEFENVTVVVTLEEWEMQFIEMFTQRKKSGFSSDGARRTAWSRVKKTLLDKGLIKVEGDYVWKT